ncbi:MAG: nitrilase [Desulfobacterales bacterium]|nr:nitrilase [Desulfobacterales bacterium]
MKDIRIAAVIFNSVVNQPSDNLDRMTSWIKEAKHQGADLICFPELNVTGYNAHPDIKDFAEKIPGATSKRLQHMAQEDQMVVLAGMVEENKRGKPFASHLVVTPECVAGVYRKLYIAPPEHDTFTPGQKIPLFHLKGIVLGVQLCYDAHFPELSSHMALAGADIIFMPHASPRGTPQQKLNSWMRHLTARAFDNGVFIVACNQVGENQKGLHFPGIAVVIGPSGNIIEKNVTDKESMLVVDLKADVLKAVRGHKMRYFLPNRRPELYLK